MELFTKLSEIMGEGCTLTINLAKTNDKMTASVLPGNALVKDAAKNKIVPLNICGTPEELDEGFVNAIIQPVASTNKMLVDMKSFEETLAAAKAASEMEKQAKEEAAKGKDLFTKWMKLADKNFKENKFKDAITCAQNAQKYSESVKGGKDKADALVKKCNEQTSENLFGAEDMSDGKSITLGKETAAVDASDEEENDNE